MTEEKGAQTYVIFVVGNKGAGKSTFSQLGTLKKSLLRRISHSLSGGDQKMRAAQHPSGHTIIVDTPGFDDNGHPNRIFISKVTAWYDKNYQSKDNILVGIVFLQKITDNRMSEDPFQTIRALVQSLSSKAQISRIVLATSMWSDLKNRDQAQTREKQLTEMWVRAVKANQLPDIAKEELMQFEKTSLSVDKVLNSIVR